MVYYNENDPKAAAWLRDLILIGAIAEGDVDERSIEDVTPNDLRGFTQCHFFAGIGGWSYALRLAGIRDDFPLWTGSCPCQPFSAAGKGKGFADERHLWPSWFWLIQQCRPQLIFGEQVANALPWFDLVSTDLEPENYACAAAIIGAHSVGAPHIRQRLYWVAYNNNNGFRVERCEELLDGERPSFGDDADGRRENYGMGDAVRSERRPQHRAGKDGFDRPNFGREETHSEPRASGEVRSLADDDDDDQGSQGRSGAGKNAAERLPWESRLVYCTDGKYRPVPLEPAFQPLVDGSPNRVASLRGYGNAIVPQTAAAFIEAYFQCVKT